MIKHEIEAVKKTKANLMISFRIGPRASFKAGVAIGHSYSTPKTN